MEKLMSFFSLFRKGSEVADPTKWKKHQVSANMVGGVILAIVAVARSYGYKLPIDDATALTIGGGIVAIVNVVLTVVTSTKAGLGKAPDTAAVDTASKVEVRSNNSTDTGVDDTYFG